VAVTRFCEQPSLHHIGGTKDPRIDDIVDLRPDLVVVNDEENRKEDADALVAAGLAVHVVTIAGLADVAAALATLRTRLGLPPAPETELPPPAAQRLRAFVPIWRRPWMTLGGDTYGSSLLAHLGVGNVFADQGRYPEVTLDEAAARRPDIVLAPSEPYPFAARHRPELGAVASVVLVDGQDLFWWGTRTPAALRRLASVLPSSGRP
jgi:ABC-type Fe3+-hydroxamate transport system substrate-binding protein